MSCAPALEKVQRERAVRARERKKRTRSEGERARAKERERENRAVVLSCGCPTYTRSLADALHRRWIPCGWPTYTTVGLHIQRLAYIYNGWPTYTNLADALHIQDRYLVIGLHIQDKRPCDWPAYTRQETLPCGCRTCRAQCCRRRRSPTAVSTPLSTLSGRGRPCGCWTVPCVMKDQHAGACRCHRLKH